MENENSNLRSRLEVSDQISLSNASTHTNHVSSNLNISSQETKRNNSDECTPKPNDSTIDVKEYHRVQRLLAESNREYGKVKKAHVKLLSKYGREKTKWKTWVKYIHCVFAKDAEKKARGDTENNNHTAITILARHDLITSPDTPSSSGENSTPCPGNIFPSPISIEEAVKHPRFLHQYENLGLDKTSHERGSTDNDDVKRNDSHNVLKHTEHNSFTEAPANSNEIILSVAAPANHREGLWPRTIKQNVISEEDESEYPIVISERSLKRKHSVEARDKTNNKTSLSGSAAKPHLVKSEHDSSSPVPATALYHTSVVHDSLDLDEFGDTISTPRKRRRLEELRRRSSNLRPSSPIQQEQTLLEDIRRSDDDAVIADEVHFSRDEIEDGSDDGLPIFDKAYFDSAAVDDIGPIEKVQSKTDHRQEPMLESNNEYHKTSQGIRSSKLAMQRMNNQRTINRQARIDDIHEALEISRPRLDELTSTTFEVPALPNSSKAMQISAEVSHGPFNKLDASDSRIQEQMEQTQAPVHKPAALRLVDGNALILPRTGVHSLKPAPRARNRRDHGASAVPLLAEDGESNTTSERLVSRRSSPVIFASGKHGLGSPDSNVTRQSPGTHRRLGNLLTEPSLLKPPLHSHVLDESPARLLRSSGTRTKQYNRNTYITKSSATPLERGKRFSPAHKDTRDDATHQTAQYRTKDVDSPLKSALLNHPDKVFPDHEPLRARPLHRLHLDNFKINPATNHDLTFAYHEVVRNRQERKCMPGCMKPTCCGAVFRKMVELGGFTEPRNSGLWESSQVDEAEDEWRLLEDYLGNDRSSLHWIADAERRELLIQARGKVLANQHGKHRGAHERRSTPPGFWETDMPTTQEAEKHREAAMVMEREKVAERYKEAMRPDGRWKFRDE